jgi:hypothetical protein
MWAEVGRETGVKYEVEGAMKQIEAKLMPARRTEDGGAGRMVFTVRRME